MLSAILFDLGGTLIEETSHALNTAQGYYEIQVKAIHHSLKKDGVSVDWSLFKKHYEEVRVKQIEKSKQTLREYDMRKRVSNTLSLFKHDVPFTSPVVRRAVDAYMNVYVNTLRIQQSTYDILRSLAANYTLGLVTNFAYSPGAHRILDRFALKTFFKTVVVSGEVGWTKPSRHIFEIALSQLSLKPTEAVFVGDDYEADIAGAKNVGLKTIFLSKESTDNEKADVTIDSFTELPSAIKRLLQ